MKARWPLPCWSWLTLFLVAAPAAPSASAAKPPAIVVEKSAVRIERRTFDPKNPPADMPKLVPPEAGVCRSEFGCKTEIRVQMPAKARKNIKATVVGVRVEIFLNIVIWTAQGAPAKLIEHEEAHRRICEAYYEQGELIARRLATPLVGRVVIVPAEGNAALQKALGPLQRDVIAAYLRATNDRCTVAQTRFDEITAHGTRPVPVSDAMARALNEELRSQQ